MGFRDRIDADVVRYAECAMRGRNARSRRDRGATHMAPLWTLPFLGSRL